MTTRKKFVEEARTKIHRWLLATSPERAEAETLDLFSITTEGSERKVGSFGRSMRTVEDILAAAKAHSGRLFAVRGRGDCSRVTFRMKA